MWNNRCFFRLNFKNSEQCFPTLLSCGFFDMSNEMERQMEENNLLKTIGEHVEIINVRIDRVMKKVIFKKSVYYTFKLTPTFQWVLEIMQL